jgi:hypothetical protein
VTPRIFQVPFRKLSAISGRISGKLHLEFRSIRDAKQQLDAYPGHVDSRIALLVVHLDPIQTLLEQQHIELHALAQSQPVIGLELVLQISPP